MSFPQHLTSILPDAVLELIRDHLTYPQKDLAISDLFNFRLVCRKWEGTFNEVFWMRWLRNMGFGRHIDQYSSSFPLSILPCSRIFHSDHPLVLHPSYALVHRRPLWGAAPNRSRLGGANCIGLGGGNGGNSGDVYDLGWFTSSRFATWPVVDGFMVGVGEYIPKLNGFEKILVTSETGVTIADFWRALDDWFDQPLTESQQSQLLTLHVPSLQLPPDAPESHRLTNRTKVITTYPTRGRLATKPFAGVRQSKVGSLLIPVVWQAHEIGGEWEPKRDPKLFGKQAKTRVFPAIATDEDEGGEE